jgi:hypothetical protein
MTREEIIAIGDMCESFLITDMGIWLMGQLRAKVDKRENQGPMIITDANRDKMNFENGRWQGLNETISIVQNAIQRKRDQLKNNDGQGDL